MPIKNQDDVDHIRQSINTLASKNNTSLIFFSIFLLYILISVLNTSDLMLLLPEHTFKMPLIDFDLNLIAFYILAPCLLLMLHFNILFNYNMYLKKLDADIVQKHIKEETLDPSIYEYAYSLLNRGASGFWLHLFLWVWIYLIPLFILTFIYQRFADYHSLGITIFHGVIIFLDVLFIALSFYYNEKHLKGEHISIRILRYFIYSFLFFTVVMVVSYFYIFFKPVSIDEYRQDTIEKIGKSAGKQFICQITIIIPSVFFGDGYTLEKEDDNPTDYTNCFPRLVVNEAEMAKISRDALYIPRYMIENYKSDQNHSNKDKDIEKELILEYGARTNLKNRNLRYADLRGCILTRVDFKNSDLQGSNLQSSHLQASDLSFAKLQDANLALTRLEQSIWKQHITSDKKSKLYKPTLSGINLSNAKSNDEITFSDLNLTDINMYRVKFKSANFENTILERTDMSQSTLTDVKFGKADLSSASLRGSDLTSTDFFESILIGTDFSNTYISTKESNTSLKSIFENANSESNETRIGTRIGGIVISEKKLEDTQKPPKFFLDDTNLDECQKYLTIYDVAKGEENVHIRRIQNLNRGIIKYREENPKCKNINSKLLSKKLKIVLRDSCTRLKLLPYKSKSSEQFLKSCQSVESICTAEAEVKDLCIPKKEKNECTR